MPPSASPTADVRSRQDHDALLAELQPIVPGAAKSVSPKSAAEPAHRPIASDKDVDVPLYPTSRIGDGSVRRSTSSNFGRGLLKRFASQSSARSKETANQYVSSEEGDAGANAPRRRSSQSSSTAGQNNRLSKAELAELSKPKGKYKSGVRWDQYDEPEPFMEAWSTTHNAGSAALEQGLTENAMLTSESTAAARSYLANRSLAEPIQVAGVPTVAQTLAAVTQSGVTAGVLTETGRATETAASPAAPPKGLASSEIQDRPLGDETSREANEPRMVAEAAQRILEAARKQARTTKSKKGLSIPASPQTQSPPKMPGINNEEPADIQSHPIETADRGNGPDTLSDDAPKSQNDSSAAKEKGNRARSLVGTIKDKGRRTMRSRKNSISGPRPAISGSKSPATQSQDGSTAAANGEAAADKPGGVDPSNPPLFGRRRRYKDTRDLDLLAYELATDALARGIPEPAFARKSRSGSSSPLTALNGLGASLGHQEARRRSYHSMGSASEHSSSVSYTSLANLMMQPMTQIHPEKRSREASISGPGPNTRTASQSVPSSPPMRSREPPRNETNHDSAPSSPYVAQATAMMPAEMLTGLGGSPYPSLPRKIRDPLDGIDNLDPFGIPLSHDSPFDATAAYVNRTNVYHTPTQVAHSRNRGASPSSGSGAAPRKSVLQMKMHDPESEMQGLTKTPKAKRLTPFGSRAGSRGSSRAPSPNPSYTNLRDAAKMQPTPRASMEKETQMAHSSTASPASRRLSMGGPGKQEVATAIAKPAAFENESQATPRAEAINEAKGNQQLAAVPKLAAEDDGRWPINAAPAKAATGDTSARLQLPEADNLGSLPRPSPSHAHSSSKALNRFSTMLGIGKKKRDGPAAQQGRDRPVLPAVHQAQSHRVESGSSASARGPSLATVQRDAPTGIPAEAPASDVSRAQPSIEEASDQGRSSPYKASPVSELPLEGNSGRRNGAAQGELASEKVTSSSPVSGATTLATDPSSLGASSNLADRSSAIVADHSSKGGNESSSATGSGSIAPRKSSRSSSNDASIRTGSSGAGNVRRFLRRLSSFGASSAEGTNKRNDAKSNFPDASTMPTLTPDLLSKAGIGSKEVAKVPDGLVPAREGLPADGDANAEIASLTRTSTVPFGIGDDDDTTMDITNPATNPEQMAAQWHTDGMDSHQAPLNEEMAKSGFGTRSAYVFSTLPSKGQHALPCGPFSESSSSLSDGRTLLG